MKLSERQRQLRIVSRALNEYYELIQLDRKNNSFGPTHITHCTVYNDLKAEQRKLRSMTDEEFDKLQEQEK